MVKACYGLISYKIIAITPQTRKHALKLFQFFWDEREEIGYILCIFTPAHPQTPADMQSSHPSSESHSIPVSDTKHLPSSQTNPRVDKLRIFLT